MPMLRKVVLATLLVAMASAVAMACDCVTRSDAESFANADEVFIGKATGTFTWASRDATTFEITRWLKGHERERVVIPRSHSDCDVSFFYGQTYVVYAKSVNGELVTSICSGTRVIGGQFEFREHPVHICDNYEGRLSYQRIAAITACSVALSLTLGVCVGAIKRRFRK